MLVELGSLIEQTRLYLICFWAFNLKALWYHQYHWIISVLTLWLQYTYATKMFACYVDMKPLLDQRNYG